MRLGYLTVILKETIDYNKIDRLPQYGKNKWARLSETQEWNSASRNSIEQGLVKEKSHWHFLDVRPERVQWG